jgi:hypothetical protein
MVFNTGGITINNTGSLIQDASLNRDIWINGGYFINNSGGKANFRYFLVSAGSLTNAGSYTVSAMTNSIAFANTGIITMDSMYVAGNLTNAANGTIIGDSITNATGVTFTNYGRVNVTWSTNNGTFINNNYHGGYAFTNAGTYNNNDSLILTGSTWNKNVFNNNVSGRVRLTKNFHNYSIPKTAVYNNNGFVTVLDSWYNTDTIKGSNSGFFNVADTSANAGIMKGTFNFCDLTPPTTWPYVDLNSGSIATSVIFCLGAGVEENEKAVSKLYPNPSNGTFRIISDFTEVAVVVCDVTGKTILEKTISASDTEIKLHQPDGVYFVKIKDEQSGISSLRKLIIQN